MVALFGQRRDSVPRARAQLPTKGLDGIPFVGVTFRKKHADLQFPIGPFTHYRSVSTLKPDSEDSEGVSTHGQHSEDNRHQSKDQSNGAAPTRTKGVEKVSVLIVPTVHSSLLVSLFITQSHPCLSFKSKKRRQEQVRLHHSYCVYCNITTRQK